MIPEVDDYINNLKKWREEVEYLRSIALHSQMKETLKWKVPCYTINEKNVSIISSFKDAAFINFFKGALLTDPHKILVKPGENSQTARYLKFSSLAEIIEKEHIIVAYINEAIAIEKSGQKVIFKKISDNDFPEELQTIFNLDQSYQEAFMALTPGRQRGYLLHFTSPKQSKTRTSRIENAKGKVMIGKGIQDCTCGLSNRMPRCDGSHKSLG